MGLGWRELGGWAAPCLAAIQNRHHYDVRQVVGEDGTDKGELSAGGALHVAAKFVAHP
jgi:hypothetical protein